MLFSSNGHRVPLRAAQGSSKAEPSKAPRPLRVLIAEDDRDNALTLMMLLREEGHEVRAVHSGRHVMGAILDFEPEVVILDIQLPERSGWEVARTIRARPKHQQPILIGISGEYKQGSDRILSEILGFDHYLLKPCDPNTLLALIAAQRFPSAEQ